MSRDYEAERRAYAEYIAGGLRYAEKETRKKWPAETVIVTKSYDALAEYDELLGMKILVMDVPSSYDYFLAFPAEDAIGKKSLQKAFLEYIDFNAFDG